MPRVDEKSQVIIFDREDWLTGEENFRVSGNLNVGVGLDNSESIDPYIVYGYARPCRATTNVTDTGNVLTADITQMVAVDNNGYAIEGEIGGNRKIHKIENVGSISGQAFVNAGNYPHTISSVYRLWDIVEYAVGASTRIFYSYSTASGWNVGMLNPSGGGTFDDDYMSTEPATPLADPYLSAGLSGVDHPMFVASNNKMYIGDRNFVHVFDGQLGSNGTFQANQLDLPTGYQIVDFVEWNGYLVVFANKYNVGSGFAATSRPMAFFWDTFSSSFTYAKSCKGFEVYTADIYQDTILINVGGQNPSERSGNNRMLIFNGDEFVDFAYFGTTMRGGIDIVGDDIWFVQGSELRLIKPYGDKVSCAVIRSGLGANTLSFVRNINRFRNPFFSHQPFTSTYRLGKLESSSETSASLITKSVSPNFQEYSKGRLRKIKIFFSGTVNNTLNLTFSMLDADDSFVQIYETTTSVGKRIVEINVNDLNSVPLQEFTRQALALTWSSNGNTTPPTVEKVLAYYEPINV